MSFWERVFNWQSDQDWTWGPFLALRPARDTPIRPWVWARVFLIFTGLGLGLIALLTLAAALLGRLIANRHRAPPPPVPETLATLHAMASDPATRALLVALVLALPPLFFLFCLPYHWAWNRRAGRLRSRAGADHGKEESDTEVWPPAPRKNNL